ncbi:MAG: DUF3857 domain-containing protein, partial [Candidatus Hodarchaeota archaeon]
MAGLSEPVDKMRIIYDYIRTTIIWDSTGGIVTGEDLDDVFKKQRGGGPEIALMLTAMLRFAGLDAFPVLISTRNNGKIFKKYPLANQFNHVLTYVIIAEREYLIDATDPLRPYDLLPIHALNHLGRLIDKNMHTWIYISSPGQYKTKTTVSATLSDSGKIAGHFENIDEGYSSFFHRDTLQNKIEADYIKDRWFVGHEGARIDSFSVTNTDSIYQPLCTKVYFKITDRAQTFHDYIVFNPTLFGGIGGHSLKQKNRQLPVDFAIGENDSLTIELTFPEDYMIYEQPVDYIIQLPYKAGEVRRKISTIGNKLLIQRVLFLRKTVFQPEEYNTIKEFYDNIVNVDTDYIVLKCKTPISSSIKMDPIVWGEIPRCDLEMTEYKYDTTASSIILGDIGKIFFNNDLSMTFTRHKRVKIISDSISNFMIDRIPFFPGSQISSITNFEGQIFSLAADSTEKCELFDMPAINKTIFSDKSNVINFSLPYVTPGSVLEYRYEVYAPSPKYLTNWYFSNRQPTRQSEFYVRIPGLIYYLEASCQDGISGDVTKPFTSYPGYVTDQRWAMKNIPAFKEAPFMPKPDDYRHQVRYMFAKFFKQNKGWICVVKSWKQIAKELMRSNRFGRQINLHKA